MITELTGVGYSWRSLMNWLHCCPSCLSWKLWGTIFAPNSPLLVYISSQWDIAPLFLQHSNREICSLKLHMYIVQQLYPLFTMWVCFISHSSMNTLEFECISLISRFSLLKRGNIQYVHFITCIMSRDHITLSWTWFQDYHIFVYGPLPLFLHSHCMIAP